MGPCGTLQTVTWPTYLLTCIGLSICGEHLHLHPLKFASVSCQLHACPICMCMPAEAIIMARGLLLRRKEYITVHTLRPIVEGHTGRQFKV